ncbi:MAG: RnfABCDGE type electron transport complex subunit B [Gammaproteobacteria bacterium]
MRSHVAFIREDVCIGCTKCIDVCPTDAIVGASSQAHTVVASLCIACDLCLPPCPVNCIDLVDRQEGSEKISPAQAKVRIQSRLKRLAKEEEQNRMKEAALRQKTPEERKAEIAAAIKRRGEK